MKKLLALVLSIVLLAGVNVYAMDTNPDDNDKPSSEAACVNEIISGIKAPEPKQNIHTNFITPINANDIQQRKKLLRSLSEANKKTAAAGICLSDEDRVVIYYVNVPDDYEPSEIKSFADKCVTFQAKLTIEQVVDIWSTYEVDEEKIPNKKWKQDLEEVKEILDLN